MSEWSLDARMLVSLMEDISEDCYCAGWMQNLEYDLWAIVTGDRARDYGMCGLTDDQVSDLRTLSERIGGWIGWHDGDPNDWSTEAWRRIVPLVEWHQMYEQQRPRILELERIRQDPEAQRDHAARVARLLTPRTDDAR